MKETETFLTTTYLIHKTGIIKKDYHFTGGIPKDLLLRNEKLSTLQKLTSIVK